ncbi:PDZ domain-containing protein [Burkholderiales bacterium]|nr:PDZ domain-containing protein [Burkholderiales bacterium]
MTSVHYSVSLEEAHAHLFNVTCQINGGGPKKFIISLPAWIPGSYLIRDFAKNIVRIKAYSKDVEIKLKKIDKDSWSVENSGGPLTIYYQIYARDQSVRTAYLDQFRGFFNGTSLFLKIHGLESGKHLVQINRPSWANSKNKFRVATSMDVNKIDSLGFGTYEDLSYASLIDHPFEIGDFNRATFNVNGVCHEVVITGNSRADLKRICNDLKLIVKTQIKFWGELPVNRYTFLINAVSDGYGGLEHSHSTALICSKKDLPVHGNSAITDDYIRFLGLCSHEYFHLWNIKRIKPAALSPYDLTQENYTELLWAFEGITSYYDDLMLFRAGLINTNQYLNLVARTLTVVQKSVGRTKQTLADSSYYAWTKFYKQDESAINSIVSYYSKGSLAALCLDLHLRSKTNGRISLDNVMTTLWNQYGRNQYGVPENGIEQVASQVSGLNLNAFFDRVIRSTKNLPVKTLLKQFGINLNFYAATDSPNKATVSSNAPQNQRDRIKHDLGLTYLKTSKGFKVKQVIESRAAQKAGIAPDDLIIAINRRQIDLNDPQKLIDMEKTGGVIPIHIFRDDVLYTLDFQLIPASKDTAYLSFEPSVKNEIQKWLD